MGIYEDIQDILEYIEDAGVEGQIRTKLTRVREWFDSPYNPLTEEEDEADEDL